MKRVTVLIILLAFSVHTYAQKKPKIKGNRVVTEMTKELFESFNAIEIDDALELTLTQGSSNSYYIKTDENLHDIVQFSVRDSILKIYSSNKIVSSKKLEIELTITEIEHIILKNDAKVEGKGQFSSDKMYISAYNSSRFDLDIEADDVTVTMHRNAGGKLKVRSENTTIIMNDRTDLKATVVADKIRVTLTKSAQLKLSGDSDYSAFNLKDSAELDAQNMKASSVDLYTSNSADVYVYASKNIELYARGNSNVYVYGDAKLEVKGLTDKSKIIKK